MSEEVVRLFILELQERPGLKGPEMSTHSVANRVIGLKTFFGWLVQKGYTNGHLLEDIKHPKKAQLIIETLTLAEREGKFWRSQIHLSMKDGVIPSYHAPVERHRRMKMAGDTPHPRPLSQRERGGLDRVGMRAYVQSSRNVVEERNLRFLGRGVCPEPSRRAPCSVNRTFPLRGKVGPVLSLPKGWG